MLKAQLLVATYILLCLKICGFRFSTIERFETVYSERSQINLFVPVKLIVPYICVNIESSNGELPGDAKPLPNLLFTFRFH